MGNNNGADRDGAPPIQCRDEVGTVQNNSVADAGRCAHMALGMSLVQRNTARAGVHIIYSNAAAVIPAFEENVAGADAETIEIHRGIVLNGTSATLVWSARDGLTL